MRPNKTATCGGQVGESRSQMEEIRTLETRLASSDREARCTRSESAVEYTAHEPGYSLFFQNKVLSPFNLEMKMSAIFRGGEAKSVFHSKVKLAEEE